MKQTALFERNKETLKFMLSDKHFTFADYTMLSSIPCIEYSQKDNDYTITIALYTNNTISLKICNNRTKNLILSKMLKPNEDSEAFFIMFIARIYDFIISFKNLFV